MNIKMLESTGHCFVGTIETQMHSMIFWSSLLKVVSSLWTFLAVLLCYRLCIDYTFVEYKIQQNILYLRLLVW